MQVSKGAQQHTIICKQYASIIAKAMQAMRTTACGSPMVVCAYSFAAIGSSILAQALGIWALGAFGPKGPGVYRMGGRGGGIYGRSIYIGGGHGCAFTFLYTLALSIMHLFGHAFMTVAWQWKWPCMHGMHGLVVAVAWPWHGRGSMGPCKGPINIYI